MSALREREQVVGLGPVGNRLEVLAAVLTPGDDELHSLAWWPPRVERVLARLDSSDRFVLRQVPTGAIWVGASDVVDPLVRVVTVGLMNAVDSDCHGWPSRPGALPNKL
jgi:hypothetical protein